MMLLKIKQSIILLESAISGNNFSLEISDFRVNSGESIGIMGRSGAGKTTFARFLTGLIKPETGSVELGKDNLTVGMTFQFPENQFYLGTIYEDIIVGLIEKGVQEDDARKLTNSALERVNLSPAQYADKNHQRLSVGEERRAALATLLCNDYDMFIFDEPSAGLDGKEIRNLISIFHNLKQDGKTLLIISQNSDFIAETCERLVVLDDCKIEYDGSLSKFFFDEELPNSFGLEIPPVIQTQMHLNSHHNFNFQEVINVKDLKIILDNSMKITAANRLT